MKLLTIAFILIITFLIIPTYVSADWGDTLNRNDVSNFNEVINITYNGTATIYAEIWDNNTVATLADNYFIFRVNNLHQHFNSFSCWVGLQNNSISQKPSSHTDNGTIIYYPYEEEIVWLNNTYGYDIHLMCNYVITNYATETSSGNWVVLDDFGNKPFMENFYVQYLFPKNTILVQPPVGMTVQPCPRFSPDYQLCTDQEWSVANKQNPVGTMYITYQLSLNSLQDFESHFTGYVEGGIIGGILGALITGALTVVYHRYLKRSRKKDER